MCLNGYAARGPASTHERGDASPSMKAKAKHPNRALSLTGGRETPRLLESGGESHFTMIAASPDYHDGTSV